MTADLARLFGLRRTATYALTREPGFPARWVLSSRCHRWPAGPVLEFRESLRGRLADDDEHDLAQPGPSVSRAAWQGNAGGAATRTVPPVRTASYLPHSLCPLDVWSRHQVSKALAVAPRTVYALARSAGFPAPYVVSSTCYRWPAVEVLAWRDTLGSNAQATGERP